MNRLLTPHHVHTMEANPLQPPAGGMIRQVFVLQNHLGLHCRPAALLINSLKDQVCTVLVDNSGVVANARSLFELMNLAAGYQAKLTFTITGPDAASAMAAIQHLFETKFADAYDEDHPLSHKRMRAF